MGIEFASSNISSERFIGMSGEGFQTGLAIAAFEWIAAIALVFVALVLLPRFLQAGIYTLPEYLEFRFGPIPRVIMAAYLMTVYVVVGLAGILYAGSLALTSIFGLNLTAGVWAIGVLAGGYTIYGGLKAVVWSDMLQGIALLGGGAVLFFLSMNAVGGFGAFLSANQDRLHLMLPADHPTLPWTIYLMGIWVPNIAYWGLNQFISQRALAARSLASQGDSHREDRDRRLRRNRLPAGPPARAGRGDLRVHAASPGTSSGRVSLQSSSWGWSYPRPPRGRRPWRS